MKTLSEEINDIRRRAGLPVLETSTNDLNGAIDILARTIASHGDSNDFDIEDEEHAREELTSNAEIILNNTTQGKLKIYRMVCIQENTQLYKNELGVSWSSYLENAQCWNEDERDSTKLLITALVDTSSVNWLETLYHNLHGDFYDEQEVRLLPKQPVAVQSVAVQSGRAWTPYMEGFAGSTGSKYYNDIANRGSDFVKWASKRSR